MRPRRELDPDKQSAIAKDFGMKEGRKDVEVRAARLLADMHALDEVAYACGYYDQSHLDLDFRHFAAAIDRMIRSHFSSPSIAYICENASYA